METENAQQPATLAEAINRVVEELSEDRRREIRRLDADELAGLHLTLGAYIRNTFGLWGDNEALHMACVPDRPPWEIAADDASAVIVRGVWEQLRGEDR
ncbi:MAG TPA: DUF6794 domain-containing protein [Herpetosiphonaceae bacterium]|nr:DUF6794 domain-containing protein [Herpetosiphonaceae bacterium]